MFINVPSVNKYQNLPLVKKGCIAKIHQVKGEKEQIVFKEAKVKNENGIE